MTLLQRLLLLPLLSPLLALLLLGAVNPRPWAALRLLTWVSPALPLGVWISAAAAAGAGLSAAGTALALQVGREPQSPRRQVRQRADVRSGRADVDDSADRDGHRRWPAAEPATSNAWAGPARAAGEPPPTVTVPFRVIRRGQGRPAGAKVSNGGPGARPEPTAPPGAGGDDDWATPSSDDW